MRFRFDGKTVDPADVPKLNKAENTRSTSSSTGSASSPRRGTPTTLRAWPPGGAARLGGGPAAGLRQRLAESYEAALRIADGRALAVELDAAVGEPSAAKPAPVEHLFSSKFSCPLCDYSLPELEPRLFSFNSPVGACPTCGGLGVTTVFDADRVVAFPSLSLASGAVKGWDRRNAYTFSLLESVSRHYGFDIDTPFEELPESAREVLLRGSGSDEIEFVYEAEGARGSTRSSASIRSKASCPTSSAASERPTRPRCART